MKITLVAHDVAPSQCFARLSASLLAAHEDLEVTLLVGLGKPLEHTEEVVQANVQQSDFVLLGMSSSPEFADIEMKAGEWARAASIPYGFYSDVPLAVYRAREGAWFHKLAQTARLVAGLVPNSEETVQTLFPVAHMIATGNPLREEMSSPCFTRAEVRVVVEFTGSASVEAAYRRIPIISVIFEVWLKKFEKECGLRQVETVEAGASIPVYGDSHTMGEYIQELQKRDSLLREQLRKKQIATYPLAMKRGEALERLTKTVLGMVSQPD